MGSLSLGVFLAAGAAAAAKIGGGGGPPPGDGGGSEGGGENSTPAATPEDRLDASYKSLAQVERAYEASLSHEQLAAENEAKKMARYDSQMSQRSGFRSKQRW